MKANSKANQQWGAQHFQRVMQQYRAAMEPHLDKMETESGQLGMMMVSGIAALVANGLESPAALATTIKLASIKSGIPEDALEAHARFTTATIQGYEFDQHQNKSSR